MGALLCVARRWLNAIGLVLGIIGVSIVWYWSYPQPSYDLPAGTIVVDPKTPLPKTGKTAGQIDAEKADEKAHHQNMSRAGLVLIAIAFALQLANEVLPRPVPEDFRTRNIEHAPKKWWCWWLQRQPIEVFTLCLVGVGVLQWIAIRGQQSIMQGQLNEMQAEQRPWISVKITGAASLLQSVGGDLQLHVNYHLENVGKLPATQAFFYATIVPATDAADFHDAIKAACERFIGRMKESPNSVGVTLFPNQTIDDKFGIQEVAVTDFTVPGALVPVCMVYRFKGDASSFHYTPAAYTLVTPTPAGLPAKVDIAHMPGEGVAVEIRPLAQGNLDPT